MEAVKEKMETAATHIATGNERMETGRAKAASAGAWTAIQSVRTPGTNKHLARMKGQRQDNTRSDVS